MDFKEFWINCALGMAQTLSIIAILLLVRTANQQSAVENCEGYVVEGTICVVTLEETEIKLTELASNQIWE